MVLLKIFTVLLLSLCFIYIIIDAARPDWTEKSDEKVALEWQENDSRSLEHFFEAITILGSPNSTIPVLLLLFYILPRHKIPSVKLIIYTVISAYFVSTVKNLYEKPRPFQKFPSVEARECEPDFGKPSGHSMVGLVLVTCIYWLLIHPKTNKNKKVIIGKVLYIIVGICIILLVGLSRLYLGVHSLSEVIIGWIYGIFFMILYINLGPYTVDKLIKKLVVKDESNRLLLFLLVTALFVVFLLTAVLIYICTRNDEDLTYWISQVRLKCEEDYKDVDMFYAYNFGESATIAVAFGTLYGFLMLKRKRSKEEYKSSFPKWILRLAIYAIVAGVIIAPPNAVDSPDNVWVKFFVIKVLPFFLIGLFLTGILPLVFAYVKLGYKNIFLEEEAEYLEKQTLTPGADRQI